MGITLGADQRWCRRAGKRNRGKMSQEQTWKSLVYNTNITPDQVHTFYKTWAETYEEDMNKLQFHSAGLLADMLTDALSRGGKNDVSKLRVLDVACGTGTVGDALARRGYRSVAGLDFSREMLDRAQEKTYEKRPVYNEMIESAFGTEVPRQLLGRTFDCVVMMGGFAAGHIPLASFSTMARLCKPGGIVINMMTQKYTKIVGSTGTLTNTCSSLPTRVAGGWRRGGRSRSTEEATGGSSTSSGSNNQRIKEFETGGTRVYCQAMS